MTAWLDINYGIHDIAALFGGDVVRRARAYSDEISGVRDKDWPITARVKGTELYATKLVLTEEEELSSTCTCPVGRLCKHGAALAIHLLEKSKTSKVPTRTNRVDANSVIGPELTEWLQRFDSHESKVKQQRRKDEILFFLTRDRSDIVLEIRQARVLRDGRYGKPRELRDPTRAYDILSPQDSRLVARLVAYHRRGPSNYNAYAITDYDAALLAAVVATRRLFWQTSRRPLSMGPPRNELPHWVREHGDYTLRFPSGHRVMAAADPHYIDVDRGQIGQLDLPLSNSDLKLFATMPTVPAAAWPGVNRGMSRLFGEPLKILGGPAIIDRKASADADGEDSGASEGASEASEGVGDQPLTCEVILRLERGRWDEPKVLTDAEAIYGAQRFPLCEYDESDPPGRDMIAESRRAHELAELTWNLPTGYFDDPASERVQITSRAVADRVVPKLRSTGWKAELGDGFDIAPALTDVEWIEDLVGSDNDDEAQSSWFSYSLGVEIEGTTYSLLPILVKALRSPSIDLSLSELARGGGDGIVVDIAKDKRLYISRERLTKWLRPLLELELRGLNEDGELRLAAPLVLEMAEDPGRAGFLASSLAIKIRNQLKRLTELEAVDEPPGFVGELRDYQKRGLSWLSFIHDSGFGGILADDMGLGKTVQFLALAQKLRSEGRLPTKHPILVVAPRSVAENWRREIDRFTPELSALVHLGPKRSKDADEVAASADIIITSYQTLLRDVEQFKKIEWTCLVLDEAQAVKNPSTKLRAAVVALRAVSRICVTGTPIENRLLELWSQIDIAMPSLFGTRGSFTRVFDKPISRGNAAVLDTLRKRLRPFMLRRTKSEVELSLPPKTESIIPVELSGGQRDLYEGLRLALSKSVRDALVDRGVGGSAMIVLDALLKLRQSCCDPRLVKAESARSVKESAKLERLGEMLEDLAGSGRSTLVFSQFATMLGIIEEECEKRGIGTVKLTGQTRKRQEAIDSFQRGDVPVFLISLKAGGVGLNLTRADTVIHYDPWWNPAAETQATDRAHRIGQKNAVFVYKLIASGTVEERVVELQKKKQKLTDAALSNAGVSHFTTDDLVALFD